MKKRKKSLPGIGHNSFEREVKKMKLFIDGYEVDIKVRCMYTGKKNATQKDTMAFLNSLSCELGRADEYLQEKYNGKYKNNPARRMANDIYNQLDAVGYYDSVK